MATSEDTRAAIWNGLLDATRYHRYFDLLSQRYEKMEKVHRGIMAVFGIGALGSFFDFMPVWGLPTIGFVIFVLTIWNLVDNPAKKAALANLAVGRITILENEQRHLWERVQQGAIEDVEALSLNGGIQREIEIALRDIDLRTDDRVNTESAKGAYAVESDRYAHE